MITYAPRIKPGIQVTETIVQSATQPVAPTLASVVVGPQILVQTPIDVGTKYTGSATTVVFPNIESAAKVKTSSIAITLKDIIVTVLGQDETLAGTVDAPGVDVHAKRFLSAPTKTGIMLGVKIGDTVDAVESVSNGAVGAVDAIDLRTLSSAGTPFTTAIAGDIIVVTDSATARVVTANISSVATGGGSLTADADLPAATGLTWVITRNFSATVVGIPTDTKLELNKELSISGSAVNTFKVKRTLIATGSATADQPLAAGTQAVGSGSYTLATTSTTNDSFILASNLRVSGFNSFNSYPVVQLSGVQLEVDTTTTIIKNQTGATTPVIFGNILRVGDIILLGGGATRYTVTNVNTTTNKITLSASAGTAGDPFVTINIPEKNKPVSSSTINVEYRALRVANAGKLLEIGTAALVESIAGVFHPDNPLGVGATLQAANTGTITYVVPIESDDEQGYLKAFSMLESKDVYSIAPLSQSLTVQSFAKSHADAMSTPIKARWRVIFGNLAEPTEGTTPEVHGGSLILSVTLDVNNQPASGSTIYLYNSRANFATGVSVGDYIKVWSSTGVSSTIGSSGSQTYTNSLGTTRYFRIYRVIEKINSSKLKLEPLPYQGSDGIYTNVSVGTAEATTHIVGYQVIQVLTLSEVAQTIANIAASFSDRRFIYVTNGSCVVSFTGSPVELPGFYISAALSGLCSGTFPHQPLTNYPIAGVLGVRGGADKYDDTQQGIIAAGGGWLTTQDALDQSLPYTWQQLTTSSGDVKEQEFSFTKNLDEIAKAIVINDRRFPGRNNNVAEARQAVDAQTIAVLDARKSNSQNSPTGGILGTQIISYSYGGLVQDPVLKDVAFCDIQVVLPLPLNTIKFNLLAVA